MKKRTSQGEFSGYLFKETGDASEADADRQFSSLKASQPDMDKIHPQDKSAWEQLGPHGPITDEAAEAIRRALGRQTPIKRHGRKK